MSVALYSGSQCGCLGYSVYCGKRETIFWESGISDEIHFSILCSAGEGRHIEYKLLISIQSWSRGPGIDPHISSTLNGESAEGSLFLSPSGPSPCAHSFSLLLAYSLSNKSFLKKNINSDCKVNIVGSLVESFKLVFFKLVCYSLVDCENCFERLV